MKQNFNKEVSAEIDFIRQKFEVVGWSNDNDHIFRKQVPFMVHPSARNPDSQYKLTMTFAPAFLSYTTGGKGVAVEEQLEAWIQCTVSLEYEAEGKGSAFKKKNCPALEDVLKLLTEDIKATGWGAFKDEDALRNYFTQPKYATGHNTAYISFYMNKDYPQGYWQNHTL